MTNRYVIKFTKQGYVKYISHLDLLRLFKRAFKKAGLDLRYSQGFNPHPKMGFAQPLSLGYSSTCELIEFETAETHTTADIVAKMAGQMPAGIEILSCQTLAPEMKSLAAEADEAEYKILLPTALNQEDLEKAIKGYLAQPEIVTLKRMKKTKKMEPFNIRHMIRDLTVFKTPDFAILTAVLDCGSQSNCSPELVINSFCDFAGITTPRYEMEVERCKMKFLNGF